MREREWTEKSIQKFSADLQRVNFRNDRMEFVTGLLNEFNELDPPALDTIFEYKAEDEKMRMAEFWGDRLQGKHTITK